MCENLIEIDNLKKRYNLYNKPSDRIFEALSFRRRKYHRDFFALDGISLKVKKGETLSIIGRNGSGKSTLLKIISGVLTPSEGKIHVNGEVSALLELGTGFNPEYSGIENIYLNGTLRGVSKREMDNLIPKILEFAEIGEFINNPLKTYSSGMFARLAFSVIVSFKPEILIVDEALSVGDIFFQKKCNKYMKEEMGNTTKILVTHDMNAVASMSDRAVVLDNGKMVFEGKPLKAIEYYTKSMHTEVYQKKGLNLQKEKSKETIRDIIPWMEVKAESLGGALEIEIEKFFLKINGDSYKGYVESGDKIEVLINIKSKKKIENLIIGYLVNDKFGNAIFGENTISSKIDLKSIRLSDSTSLKISFNWPEISENDYFLTLGVGEGEHEMDHVIQCWAHNIFSLRSISKKPIHALFNNRIESVAILD